MRKAKYKEGWSVEDKYGNQGVIDHISFERTFVYYIKSPRFSDPFPIKEEDVILVPKKLIQTRLFEQGKQRGNCFPAVIASFMQMESAEDVIQIQEYYDLMDGEKTWLDILVIWIEEKGWEIGSLNGHRYDGTYYLVSGLSKRNVRHVCIYKNGKLYHDPHPSGEGIITEEYFEYLELKP